MYSAAPTGAWLIFCLFAHTLTATSQSDIPQFDRAAAVAYALDNRPELRAQRMELEAAQLTNDIALAAWKPQLLIDGSFQHYLQRPVSIFPDFMDPESGATTEVEVGTVNSSTLTAGVTQLAYSPSIIYAKRRAEPLVEAARLELEALQIDVREQVSISFYEAVQLREQLRLFRTDVERLERSLRDARLLLENGLRDKVDTRRATIALNNARLQLRVGQRQLDVALSALRQQMGYPQTEALDVGYDSLGLRSEILAATVPQLDAERRIALRQLQQNERLQHLESAFLEKAWLPTVSANASYNLNWQANTIGKLYDRVFPNSLAGLAVSLPLYQGGRRFKELDLSELRARQLTADAAALVNGFELEYRTAAETFGVQRDTYRTALENAVLAQEIYDVVDLQYREGIKPYLDVVIAESDLQTARLAALNSLFDAAIARVRLERAAGLLDGRN